MNARRSRAPASKDAAARSLTPLATRPPAASSIKALIVDDERLARSELRRLLAAHPEVEISGEARNGEEALELMERLTPDLLLLDIQMPGMNGFELLERLEDVPQVIFTTAYDQYAIRAFEVSALDYLTKPVVPARLGAALAKVRPRSVPARLERVFVREGERCWIVALPDIYLLESEGNYTRVHFSGQQPLVRRSLDSLEAQFDPGMFFRASRREIVNLKWIDRVDIAASGGLLVTLRGGKAVEMSRRQSIRLREVLSL
jgi:two-component system LytT family response regulator